MRVRTRTRVLAVAAAAAALVMPVPVMAAGPGGGGGGGGGGSPGGSGSLYADLVVALRDENGVPMFAEYEVLEEGETEPTTEYCVQPVSTLEIPGLDPMINPVDGRQVWRIPLVGDLPAPEVDIAAAPEDGEDEEEVGVCDPQPDYAAFVVEAELERLNLVRTSDEVLDMKIAEVEGRLDAAVDITLDGAGRIVTDGLPLDASPEYAAIYRALMTTGTIPGLHAPAVAGPPASIGPFDIWELSAAAIGTAASKEMPLGIDAVQYYNRIADIMALDVPGDAWDIPRLPSVTGEEFVDYREFSYNRTETFQGCATYLDVPSLTWHVDPILDIVPYGDLPPVADSSGTVHNVAGFAQLVDDVRATVNYIHENDVITGFFMDPVGENTCDSQVPPTIPDTTTTTAPTTPTTDLPLVPENGYWMATDEGEAFEFGDADALGDANLTGVVDIAASPDGQGYWMVNDDGVVTAHGVSDWFGNANVHSLVPGEEVVSISSTDTGDGYWLFTTKGRAIAFGDADHHGDMIGTVLNGPVLDSVATPSGNGYYMVASDGGIFAFGDAKFYGSMGGLPLNAPVRGIAADPDGRGYWLVATDGGVFSFEAVFRGSMGGQFLAQPVVGMISYGNGYLLVATDGGVFTFSNLPFLGSLGADPPDRPVVSIAALR